MRLSCQTEWLSTALPAFLQSLRYVSACAVTQLPFLCPRYRLPLRRRLWSPLLLSCFFLVWSARRKFTLTSGFEYPSFPYFLLFFSGLHFVTYGSFLFSPFDFVRCRFGASNDIVCGLFPCIGNNFSLYYVPSPVLIYAYFGLRYLSGLCLLV